MKKQLLLSFTFLFTLFSCSSEKSPSQELSSIPKQTTFSKADILVQNAIENAGGELYQSSLVSFTFRGRQYRSTRKGGTYQYERIFSDSSGNKIKDVLTNDRFKRSIEGKVTALTDKKKKAYSNSVNSVIYFALLPYFLNDAAVNLEYLGKSSIKDQAYDKIKVTFDQEGGREEFTDVFVYWLEENTGYIGYIAYNYSEEDIGARFRQAFNQRMINGMRFADYHNFKPSNNSLEVTTFDSLFEDSQMELLSEIILKDIEVNKIPAQ